MLITRGTLVTMGTPNVVMPDGALYVDGGTIADLGPSRELEERYSSAERLHAEGCLVMPGLICAHTHFYRAFARGMSLRGVPSVSDAEDRESVWSRLDRALWPDDVHYSTLACLIDAIRHGTTTLIDHHASQKHIDGSLDQIAAAVLHAGVRACLCYAVADRDGEEAEHLGIEENLRFIRLIQQGGVGTGSNADRIGATFGLYASLTLSDATLERCVGLARELDVGFHLQVAEDKDDVRDSLRKTALRVVERLQEAGVLGPKTLAAHCVHVDRIETELLLDSGTMVVHNPRSNMANGVGTADVPWMLHIGIPVGLGNDGLSYNMFSELDTAYLLHRQAKDNPRTLVADEAIQMAWEYNARIGRTLFPNLGPRFGQLAVGAPADVILVDYDPPTPLTSGNLPWHLIDGVDGTGVDTTIVAGQVLMRHRKLLTLDEAAIMDRARDLSAKLWRRM